MKNLLKTLFKLPIYRNAFISGAAVVLCVQTAINFQVPYNEQLWAVLWVAFWGTVFTYNLCSFYELGDHSAKYRFVKKYRTIYRRGTYAALLIPVFVLPWLSVFQIVFLVHLAVISFFYTVPISLQLPSGKAFKVPALREISFLKTLLVGYVWASVTVIFPLLDAELWITDPVILGYFLAQLLFVTAITLPFDFRDISYDKSRSVATLANTFGVKTNKVISLGMLSIATFLLWNTPFLGEKVTYGLAMLAVLRSSPRRSELFYIGAMDFLLYLPLVMNVLACL
ncbi:MAG: hypothetical protein AAF740_07075 [Bacteroidota bacterium]